MQLLPQNKLLSSNINYKFKKPTSGFLEFIPHFETDQYQKIGNFTFQPHIPINLNQIVILQNCIIINLPNNLSLCTNTLTNPKSYIEKCVT